MTRLGILGIAANVPSSEEEEPDDYPFPLTLKTKKGSGPNSPAPLVGGMNGS